jgi:hypothetical protein
MPSHDLELFNVTPYYDDFNEDKRFLRMLFRPGYAVQSRELTQLQTLLQNQIGMFGDHIFKDGSVVIGGQITTQTLNFVRLRPQSLQTATTPVAKTLTSDEVVGYNIIQRDVDDNIIAKAKVISLLPSYSAADDYAVAIVSYMSGNEFTAGATVEFDTPNLLYAAIATDSSTVPFKGDCRTVAVAEGIFYINGFFVKTNNQLQPAYAITDEIRQFANPTGSMGLNVKSTIVSERDDFTLRDPANGSYNYNAPGSHRYRIDLELIFSAVSDVVNFFELVRYDSGEVTKKFDKSQYPELVKMFAQKTYEQSGNYIVKPFSITMKEKDATTLYAEIGTGKAYVYGHEYESAFKDRVEIPKAREIGEFNEIFAQNRFDNFVVGKYKTQLGFGYADNPGRAQFHTDLTFLFEGIDQEGNPGNRPILVYGTTGAPLTEAQYNSNGFSGAVFTALMHKLDFGPSGNNHSLFPIGQSGAAFGLDMRAYLSSINVLREPTSSAPNTKLNLYSIDPKTAKSFRVLFDLDTLRDVIPESNSLLPKFNNFANQKLIFPLNGDVPTTLIKDNDKISYTHTVYRTFSVVSSINPTVTVDLGDSSFSWCDQYGQVPDVYADRPLTKADGYYIIWRGSSNESATNQNANYPHRGEIIRIVDEGATFANVGSNRVEFATGKITANGTAIQFTKPLFPGVWTLVGKVRATDQVPSSTSFNKIRIKTVQTAEETISTGLQTNKRVVNEIGSFGGYGGQIFSVYFLLNKADVFKIDSVLGSTGNDISYKFEFDSGQRDSVYGLSRLYVKPKYISEFVNSTASNDPSFTFRVQYSYFDHSGYGPFVKESYANSGISYENIPVFSDPRTGESINLVNAIDYRPVETIIGYRQRGVTGSFSETATSGANNIPVMTYEGGFVPNNYSIKSDYTAYLPRIDKIVVSKNIAADEENTTIRRVPGIASDSPQIPEDLNESMTISILSVPAYTYNPDDVKTNIVANSRLTMKDIIDVSKRVDNLEQHVVVSDIESNALYRDIKTTEGDDAIKRAVLVDSFDGHSIGDVLNPDYRCSIDIEKGELRPAFDSHAFGMEYTDADAGITITPDNILCESFIRYAEPVIQQSKASSVAEVNPFGFPNWVGDMVLTPHGDFWFDRDFRPTVKYNEDGVNDAWAAGNNDGLNGHGTQWNDWESVWTGLSVELTEAESKKNAEFFARSREKTIAGSIDKKFYNREGILRKTDPIDSNKNVYQVDFRKKDYYTSISTDTLLNSSVIPFTRDNIIVFNAYNMKPGTPVYVFVDNTDMSDICYQYDDSGATLDLVNKGGAFSTPFTTDSADGSLRNVVLPLPRGIFEVGERLIRVTDDPNNNIETATTVAEAVFYCNGIKGQNAYDIQSVRTPEIRKQTPNSNKVVSTPLYKSKNINTIKYNNWIDPMSQTFEVKDEIYPNGFYAESVDLFLASADDELPITIRLCPVINGVPHTSVVLPFSTVVKNPSELNVDSSTPVATTFKFSTPVFLAPGEYAITIHTNSRLYSVFTAKIGEKDIVTDERISSTFTGGSLFKSQNNSQTIGENNTDLMFKLYRCQFQTNANGIKTFTIKTVYESENYSADDIKKIALLQPNLFVFTPDDVTMTGTLEADSRTYFFSNGRNVQLTEVLDEINDLSVVELNLTTTNTSGGINSFMLDMDKTNTIAVSYIIRDQPEIITEETPYAFKPKRRRRRRLGRGYFGTPRYKLLSSQIAAIGDRPIPNNSDGIVGGGLSRRGRRKWVYSPRGFVPQYITNPLEDFAVAGSLDDDNSRYITRSATISNGLIAKELKVFFDANLPRGAYVKVFGKTFNTTLFAKNPDEQPYREMTEQSSSGFSSLSGTNQFSVDGNDYREMSFTLTAPIDFNTFLVKICMYTLNKVNVPTIKNLRVVAVE